MDTNIWIITSVVIATIGIAIGIIVAILNKKFKELQESKEKDQAWQLINQNIQGMQERIDKTTQAINERLDNAARVVGTVSKELGQVQEMGRHMQDLQEFLRSPKLRGNIGEQVLKDMLAQVLPKDYFRLAHQFKNGAIVDAAIKIEAGIIPVDSKLPMENFNKMVKAESDSEKQTHSRAFSRDVKKHIDDIAKKYILPDEGTVDFALMYIPSEAVFYEIINNFLEIERYSREKKVAMVSPNNFYHLLRTIMIGLEGKRISEASRKILQTLNTIQQESKKFGANLSVLNKHVSNAKNTMDSVSSDYSQLSSKIDSIRLLEAERKEEEEKILESPHE